MYGQKRKSLTRMAMSDLGVKSSKKGKCMRRISFSPSHKGNEACKSGIKQSSAGTESVGFTGVESGETVSDDSGKCAECEGTGRTEKHWAETKYS